MADEEEIVYCLASEAARLLKPVIKDSFNWASALQISKGSVV